MYSNQTFEIYCAGKFIQTSKILEVKNPFNNSNIAKTFLAGISEFEMAMAAAQSVEEELAAIPAYVRYKVLKQISDELFAQRRQFAELITFESGKPIRYALAEVDRSIQTFAVAAEESKRLPSEYIQVDWTPAGVGKEGLLKYFPIGIVAGISPFNFPLNLAVHKIAPAIAAGCPIILKPSSLTPLSTLMLAHIIDRSGLPKGSVSILPMDRQTGNKLVTDSRISLLSFTGSPEVGWKMKSEAGKKKVVLELGGNAGVIVSHGADLEAASTKCVVGGFAYSGQVCIHTQRIYVLENLFEEFTEKFIEKMKLLKTGKPIDPDTDITIMINEANAVRVESWIAEAVKAGAKVLAGGKREGSFMQPTAITGSHEDMLVCAGEVFGPVVVIEKVNDFAAAIKRVNSGRFGLQAGVFTDSIGEMNLAFNKLHVGGVIINDVPTFRVDHTPYGGVKDSGLGREGVKYAILDMMEPRLLVKNC
ncbi:MAG: aldehyde dehydrogenase family protein [Bacteroidales bacterium]